MNQSLEHKRHTLAHLLAAAVVEQYPHAKLTLGPAIDNGFYYDIDFSDGESPGEEDLKGLQKSMKKLINKWTEWSHAEVSADEARKRFAGNQFKLEMIDEIEAKGESITLYTCGEFTDLCRGGHCENPKEEIVMDAFKLDKIAGAYWRGDEKNHMLTRIYGLAFDTKEELADYEHMIAEAKKRDHRRVAKEQGLLVFSDLVGSGMPMWTPKGNIIRNQVINYSRQLNERLGFGEVHTPNLNKAELFKCSGHYDQYKEDMMSVSSQYVKDEMFLKPMNCPQHTQIYTAEPRSYKDLPIRYADFATLYRDERPGELSGLTRLRAFAQDDGHVFCRESQVEEELIKILDIVKEALVRYGVSYWVRLSLHDPENREKYLGDDKLWLQSEQELRDVVQKCDVEYKEVTGEAAFYGPKLDIMAVDALGREWQISTIQVDRVQPERFDLTCINEQGEKERVVMIHRALIGSPDRFIGILIEHYAGNFPLWLAPEQIAIIPVAEAHNDYAQNVHDQLMAAGFRSQIDTSSDSMGKKVRAAKKGRLPYFVIIGDKDIEGNTVTVESRDTGESVVMRTEELLAKLSSEASV